MKRQKGFIFMKEEIVQQLSELKQRVEEMRGYL
jgi:hypothetical protein